MFRKTLLILSSLSLIFSLLPITPTYAYSTGTWAQTDWSGGSGQAAWSDETMYNTAGGDGVLDGVFIEDTKNCGMMGSDHCGNSYISGEVGKLSMLILADNVLGQADFGSSAYNYPFGSVSAHGLNNPMSITYGGGEFFIVDAGNNRILGFNSLPVSINQSADFVLGQTDLDQGLSNQGGLVATSTLSNPYGAYSDGAKLFIADTYNNRVLIYNSIPHTNNASPDVVVGQTGFSHGDVNQSGSLAANTLDQPSGVYSDGTKLFISDYSNGRVLIYNTIPTSNNASADVVLGQVDFSTLDYTISASNYFGVGGNVYSSGTKLFIPDGDNSRVLIYNTIPTSSGASADVVLGQPDMNSGSANNGGIGANTLYYPSDVYSDGNKLYIADANNSRILIYNAIPTANNSSADSVIGQANLFSSGMSLSRPSAASTFYFPQDIYLNGTKLFLSNFGNNRVLVFSGSHTSTLTSSKFDSGVPYTLWGPLSYTATTPANTAVSFEVSTTNGASWQAVTDYTRQTFGPSQTLIYRATLSNTDGISTPTLTNVSINYAKFEGVTPGAGGNSSAGSGQAPPASIPPSPTPSPTPAPSLTPKCSPRPACLDAVPKSCEMAEPVEGWCLPSVSPRTTPSPSVSPQPSSGSITSLQNQLNSLISQLTVLLQERKAAGLSIPAGSEKYLLPSPTFQRGLSLGSFGDDVLTLQQFLNSQGFQLAETGNGSLDKETKYFGLRTKNALLKFQQANNLVPTGIFGDITRGVVNGMR